MKKHLFLSAALALFVGLSASAQIHHWPLQSDLSDVAGSLDGTNNGITFEDDATRGPVAYFDGNGYANLPSFIAGNDMTEITISCWYRMDLEQVWSRIYTIGTGDQTEPKDVLMVIPVGGNNNMYRFTLSDPEGAWVDIDMPEDIIDIQLDTWYFSAVVLKPDSIIFYHDDVKVFAESGFTRPFGTINDVENALGKSFWPDALWNGAISDFRVYETALDEDAVVSLYNETINGWSTEVAEKTADLDVPVVYARHNQINVMLNQPKLDAVVSVYNVTGALVARKPVQEINSISFESGIYIVKVLGSDVNYATKVFVQ